jgi:superfamily I DNA/RNA helicase
MKLTEEQINILASNDNIKINAVAGSGKTTTIIEYAKTRDPNSRILYLAFNKSVKLDAVRRFTDAGLGNVKVETAHSLAYKNIVFDFGYKVRAQGYKTNEIAEILGLKASGEKHAVYMVANHINKFVAYFCNSSKQKVQELDYLATLTEAKAKEFVSVFYEYILSQTRLFLSFMDKGKIEVTHDFYLKKFQLANPDLPYDYILFDEGQDASAAMLDIFLKQKAIKVIVGDTHQQIYGWRYAINSLEQVNFTDYHLTTSFRFSQEIANLALTVLSLKRHIGRFKPIQIEGKGVSKAIKTKAILARTNLGLLLKAIEYITERENVKHIYFEGNINSYTYAEEGASLYDVLNLYNERRHAIKDELIKGMKNIADLEDYIEKTQEVQLGMMVEIVKEYGNRIPDIIRNLKEKHVSNEDKDKAEIIFSTVHRCKGMEYDTVQLVNDFITEGQVHKMREDLEKSDTDAAKINEEINLLYVAVTRTRNSLYIPNALMPPSEGNFENIHVMHDLRPEAKMEMKKVIGYPKQIKYQQKEPKAYEVAEKRLANKDAYRPWTHELDSALTRMFQEGVSLKDMEKHFGRSRSAIGSRIKKLQLEELYR